MFRTILDIKSADKMQIFFLQSRSVNWLASEVNCYDFLLIRALVC